MHGFFVVGHPDLSILNGALQPHAALCQLCQDRGDTRGQVYHGRFLDRSGKGDSPDRFYPPYFPAFEAYLDPVEMGR
jgi:hypothetical protein